MRKKDYETLARIINAEISAAQDEISAVSQFSDEQAKDCARAALATVHRIADGFARSASVDRAAFLTACGVKP